MNKKLLIAIVVIIIGISIFLIFKPKLTGNVIAEYNEIPQGFTEKCLDCPNAAECSNYGNCKGGQGGESCGEHKESEEQEC